MKKSPYYTNDSEVLKQYLTGNHCNMYNEYRTPDGNVYTSYALHGAVVKVHGGTICSHQVILYEPSEGILLSEKLKSLKLELCSFEEYCKRNNLDFSPRYEQSVRRPQFDPYGITYYDRECARFGGSGMVTKIITGSNQGRTLEQQRKDAHYWWEVEQASLNERIEDIQNYLKSY